MGLALLGTPLSGTPALALEPVPGSLPANSHARCACPAALTALGGTLPHALAEVRDRQALKIVALGSSSTYGTGASSEAATYPSRLAAELGPMLPGVRIEVVNKGVPGEIALDMVHRLEQDVLALSPDLVVWQTGTNDAMRGVPVDDFAKLTIDAIGRLHAAGIDVVLMEPQWSPKLVEQANYGEYVEALRTIGHGAGAPVVRRFDIMKAWIGSGQFVDTTMLQSDSLHMKDASYACLGWVVATSIAGALDQTQPAERLTAGSAPAK